MSSLIKIASWNVNSVRARADLLIQWLHDAQPHVVLLQETKVTDAQFPFEIFEDFGYNVAVHGQKTYNGVALMSKAPLEDVTCGFPNASDSLMLHARFISAYTFGMRCASAYVPQGQNFQSSAYQHKCHFLHLLRQFSLDVHGQNELLILGGDFNIALTDADVYDEKRWKNRLMCSVEERNLLQQFISTGLQDAQKIVKKSKISNALPHSTCAKNTFTWWDYRTHAWRHNYGLRLDYIFASTKIFNDTQAYGVDTEMRGQLRPSDHAPVWITLLRAK